MKSKLALAVGMLLLVGLLLGVHFQGVSAAPVAARQSYLLNSSSITATTNFAEQAWSLTEYTQAEFFVDIDEATVNTNTIKLLVSPGGGYWFDRGNMVPSAETDTTYFTSTDIVGLMCRVRAEVGGSAAVTPTIYMILK